MDAVAGGEGGQVNALGGLEVHRHGVPVEGGDGRVIDRGFGCLHVEGGHRAFAHRQATMIRVLHRGGGTVALERKGGRGCKHNGSGENRVGEFHGERSCE